MVQETSGGAGTALEAGAGVTDGTPAATSIDRSYDRSADLLPWEGGPVPGEQGDQGQTFPWEQAQQPTAPPAPTTPAQAPWPPGFLGQAPTAPQPGPWGGPPGGQPGFPPEMAGQPSVDPALLHPEVMRAREDAEFQRFNAAYLNAKTTMEQQAIDGAYRARITQLRLESREAAQTMREQQHQHREAARVASEEPLHRQMYAEHLAETYKVPKAQLLNHPVTNEEVWDPRIMLNNALLLSKQRRQERVAQRGQADAAYAPSGGAAGGEPDFMRMKDDQFESYFQDVMAGRRQIGR